MLGLMTLGNVAVTARRVGFESAGSRGRIVFADEAGEQIAVLTAEEVHALGRVWEMRPGEGAWTLGPVEIARVKAFAGPARILRRAV